MPRRLDRELGAPTVGAPLVDDLLHRVSECLEYGHFSINVTWKKSE